MVTEISSINLAGVEQEYTTTTEALQREKPVPMTDAEAALGFGVVIGAITILTYAKYRYGRSQN